MLQSHKETRDRDTKHHFILSRKTNFTIDTFGLVDKLKDIPPFFFFLLFAVLSIKPRVSAARQAIYYSVTHPQPPILLFRLLYVFKFPIMNIYYFQKKKKAFLKSMPIYQLYYYQLYCHIAFPTVKPVLSQSSGLSILFIFCSSRN